MFLVGMSHVTMMDTIRYIIDVFSMILLPPHFHLNSWNHQAPPFLTFLTYRSHQLTITVKHPRIEEPSLAPQDVVQMDWVLSLADGGILGLALGWRNVLHRSPKFLPVTGLF